MHASGVKTFTSAADLPEVWDAAVGKSPFLKKSALMILEATNPCGQRYHLAGGTGSYSLAVTYRQRLNLLSFGRGSLHIPVTIIGVPCSVAYAGYRLHADTEGIMLRHLLEISGTKLVLNSAHKLLAGFTPGKTLPGCRLELSWSDLSDYLSSMRSHYRYRITQALSQWADVTQRVVEQGSFNSDLYQLYLNVHKRSNYKLERLSIDFFKNFPGEILEFRSRGRLLGFVHLLRDGNELIFMFAGMDYSVSREYDTYLNMLIAVVRKGEEYGVSSINFGQTTEDAKCRLGCRLEPMSMHAAHSSRIGQLLLKLSTGFLSCRSKGCKYNVFK